VNIQDMQLRRSKLFGQSAWKWIAPNGAEFFLCRTLQGNKWVWYRGERDTVSSQMFNTLDDLKIHLVAAFAG
jgi:hypothetical protein